MWFLLICLNFLLLNKFDSGVFQELTEIIVKASLGLTLGKTVPEYFHKK